MARLSDTKSLVTRGEGTEVSTSTRRIDNGYVTRVSYCDEKTGEYKTGETFSEKAPRIQVKINGKDPGEAGNPLAAVKQLLK